MVDVCQYRVSLHSFVIGKLHPNNNIWDKYVGTWQAAIISYIQIIVQELLAKGSICEHAAVAMSF